VHPRINNIITNGKAALAVAAIAIGGAVITGRPASAIVTQGDDVLLTSVGFDFGGGTGYSTTTGEPTSPGTVAWDQLSGGVVPKLNGYIHFDNVANNCARIRMTSFDAAGVQIGSPAFSTDQECVSANGHDANPMAPLVGELGAASVEITLQSSAKGSSSWGRVAQTNVSYGPTLATDEFRIIAPELDLGSGAFSSGTASDLATLTWKVQPGTSSTLTPVFNGTLYMNQADDLCGRIKVEYFSQLGTSTKRFTKEHCVEDDKEHEFDMVLNDYHATDVYEVVYTLQKRPNGAPDWTDVASSAPLFVH